jgi:nitroreductase
MSIVQFDAIVPFPTAAEQAIFDRYREPLAIGPVEWNQTLETLLSHRSVRAFLPTPLAAGTIETLVAAAQSAPTSSNIQAWSVVAVEDADRKARLSRIAGEQRHITDAPLFLVWVADLARADLLAAQRGVTLEGADFTESFLLASLDAALAAQNAVVAAESLGLGTVYIGALRNNPEAVASELGLPDRAYAVFGLVVGHPDPERQAAVKPRLPQSAVLHRERYGLDEQVDAIARHDRHIAAFRSEQKPSPQSWSDLAVDRLRDVAALKGRHLLREVLGRLGFQLR